MLDKLSEFYSNLSSEEWERIEDDRKKQSEEAWEKVKHSLRQELSSSIEGFGLFYNNNKEKYEELKHIKERVVDNIIKTLVRYKYIKNEKEADVKNLYPWRKNK